MGPIKNLLQRQMKRHISGSHYKMRRIHSSFLCLYMVTIIVYSCTKHIKTLLDFLHDRCFHKCLHKFLVTMHELMDVTVDLFHI